MDLDMDGWWCVRYGDAFAWVEAPTAASAVRRSLDLYSLGDWTDDARKLVVFPQSAYSDNSVVGLAAWTGSRHRPARFGTDSKRRNSSTEFANPRVIER